LAGELDAHSAHADEIGVGRERDGFDVLVDDSHVPRRWAQRRQRGKTERRIDRALARQDPVNRPFEAPEAFRISRIDEQQAHPAALRYGARPRRCGFATVHAGAPRSAPP
jgi:hypothetical protein